MQISTIFQNTIVGNIYACSTKGIKFYSEVCYQDNDVLLFGPESRGLPAEILENQMITAIVKLPMQPQSRSLNLSNAVAVFLYEAWRQQDFR